MIAIRVVAVVFLLVKAALVLPLGAWLVFALFAGALILRTE